MHHKTKKRQTYGPWVRAFGRGVLKLLGWQAIGEHPHVSKCVVVAAPHTTNWDLPFTLLGSYALGIPCVFMMKQNWFFFPLDRLWYWLGGVPVNRDKRTNSVQQMVQAFEESEQLFVVIPPEGTRKSVRYWKSGFYWMALGAKAPVLLGFMDYKNKRVGVGPLIELSGELEKDFAVIRAYYEKEIGHTPDLDPELFEKARRKYAIGE